MHYSETPTRFHTSDSEPQSEYSVSPANCIRAALGQALVGTENPKAVA